MPPSGSAPPSSEAGALPATRQERMLDLLHRRGQATVAELVTLLDLSRDTVRRDLDLLDQRGLLVHTHGGAIRRNSLEPVDTTLGCGWMPNPRRSAGSARRRRGSCATARR